MMSPDVIAEIVLWTVGGLLTALMTLVAWGLSQMYQRVGDIADKLEMINSTLAGIEKDLRGELAGLDRRVSQLHTAIKSLHPEYHGLDGQ